MLESFTIKNYRSFKEFKLAKLGRINLLVGENNSGKTSILEAINLSISYPYFPTLLEIFDQRGEFSWFDSGNIILNNESFKKVAKKYNVYNIFNNNTIKNNDQIHLTICMNSYQYNLDISIHLDSSSHDNSTNTNKSFETNLLKDKKLSFSLSKNNETLLPVKELPINMKGDVISSDIPKYISKHNFIYEWESNIKNQFINPFEQNIDSLINIFDKISLTPKEEIVIEALRIIEPKIKRIASTKSDRGQKSSLKVLLEGYERPISIASMGDGIWQLLTIALAMVNNQDGVLLIDEIDTGLHFTTLLKMWELILETSKKLNVQVFATTHNSDCWTALGELISNKNAEDNDNKLIENEVTLHRIESNKNESILFTAEQIAIAANREIEVR